MRNKIIGSLFVAIAVIAPISSANAYSPTVGQVGSTMLRIDDFTGLSIGDTIFLNNDNSRSYTIMSNFNPYTGSQCISGVTCRVILDSQIPDGLSAPISIVKTSEYVQSFDVITIFDNVVNWLSGSLLPAISLLVLLGISVRLSIKAVRKFSKVA